MSNIYRSSIRAVKEISNDYGVNIHIARIMYNKMNRDNPMRRTDTYDRYGRNSIGRKRW